METGQTVVLLNLQNLYESLYDALNQYYVCLGGQKYVDLGLGTHRVKCRVHKDFRLIVIEERDVVYKQFPIPLINRLEKHYLDIHTVLRNEQKRMVDNLEEWVKSFVSVSSKNLTDAQTNYQPQDVFIGYHSDTCASVILQVIEKQKDHLEMSDPERQILDEAKLVLLRCATPDSVVRLDCTGLPKVESEYLDRVYFKEQQNSCFADYILADTKQEVHCSSAFTEVTTFSRLLTVSDLEPLKHMLHSVELLSLQQFDTEHSFLKKIRFLDILIIQCDFDEASHSANLIASAKYSCLNEINKITQETTGSKVFVYFITRLPRMEGGTLYVGFHGGPWRSVHIDDLRQSKDIVSDIKALQNMTISQMFEAMTNQSEPMEVDDMDTENEQEESQFEENDGASVVDTTALLRSCVQGAVGMLRDQVENGCRSTRRVQILLSLLTDDDEIKGQFLQTVKKRLHSMLTIYDGNTFSSINSNWVIKEASNIDALQEGGTFRHTLWKRIQAVVVPLLAQLVSIFDRDQNLDILQDRNCDESLCKITILVQNFISQDKNLSCSMPFSWRIKDYLDELWVYSLHHEGRSQQEFDEFFWKTPLGRYIAKADLRFIHVYTNTHHLDFQLLCCALNCCVNELRLQFTDIETATSLPWVHAAYHGFKSRLQNLSRMMCIQPQVTKVLLTNPSARDEEEMVLDVYAAFACVEYLEPRDLRTDAKRLAWLREVKKLQVPIELICSEDSVRAGWNRIFSLSLFVEHMLVRLSQMLEKNSDLKTQQSFEVVIGLLKTCKDRAVQQIFGFNYTMCPTCLEDPQDPLCLPCKHIFCVACMKKWLIPGQMYCPFCKEQVDNEFLIVPSNAIRVLIKQHAQFRKQCNAFFIDLVSTVCFKDNSPPCSVVILHLLSFLMVETNAVPILGGISRQILTKELSPFDDAVDKNPVVRSVVLKLLLKYSFDEVKDYLQKHLTAVEQSNILDKADKTELYCLYINFLGRRSKWNQSLSDQCGQPLYTHESNALALPSGNQYLVCGEDYKTIRNAVAKVVMEGKVDGLEEACEVICLPQWKTVFLLMALYREVTTLYRETNVSFHPKPEQLDVLTTYIQTSKVLASPEVKHFARALVANQLGPLAVRQGASGAHCVLMELTIHLAAVLHCGNHQILFPLQELARAPANMRAAFLPTMPEDMLALAQQAMGPLRWYTCPNGHPCTIGECGQPMEKSRCVDCDAEIGGLNHTAVQGFHQIAPQADRTEKGHILGDPGRRDNPDMQDTKSISFFPFNIVRMLTHMAMLLGACRDPQAISATIKPQVPDPAPFLLAHLQKDVEILIKYLGKGTDDTVSAVHLLISSLLEPPQHQKWPVPYDNHLSTKEARNGWEREVSDGIISPKIKQLDRQLKEVNSFIRADSQISANPIMKLVFGDPRLFLASLPQNSLIHGSAVWSCRDKVSVLTLTHVVEQNDGKDTLPVLWRFLHKEAELRLVKHLPDILTLQRDLVKKFQNATELTYKTIDEFLHGSLRAWYEKYIQIFLTIWNQLRLSLATNGEIKIPAEFCQDDLDLNSDFKVLLPRRQGLGLCSTALVSYLIALHNDLVYCVDKHTGEETSYKVNPADLTDLHVIRYEVERDLMPLVLSNTQYSVKKGQETLHEYDLPKIQQHIISRFLQGKPLITVNGIPTLVNRQDRNYEIILKDLKAKVKQEPLPTGFAIAGELHSYSEVCEALSILEVALGFLAMTGGEPHMQLSLYLEEVLRMGNQMAPHFLKVTFFFSPQQTLNKCYLKHCVALWQLLASHKSENMLRLKRDPFVGVSEQYRQALGEDEHRLLAGFFSQCSADTFLMEMHEFLVLVLRKPNAPDTYSLKITLVSYMERKNLDIPNDVEELFPEDINLSHYVEAWKFIVTFKQERNQRQ
uniref:Uncharacterized protein n=1 Tax=Echeneis naucrates TaxID=173247 RepID=A0A665VK89_ECHNA